MEPVSFVLGAAPKAIDTAMKLVGAYRAHQDAREAELRLLRLLYFEVCRNLGVLDRFYVADRDGIASNDDAYRGVAKLLDVDAHLAVVLVRREDEDEREAVERERARIDEARLLAAGDAARVAERALERERADKARNERLMAFRAVWGDLCDESWVLDGGDASANDGDATETTEGEGAGATARATPSKVTTMLRSLAFVSVKVPTLATLGEVDEATRAVMRDVRIAVRLEQIRQHESALKRRLESLPAVAAVRV